ncbi:hypothetical protein HMPREF9519_02171 [Enterococcus faecalis TX1346]|nr:hypothetical protein HMPREF9510_00546 [Enterococcus faecalis TX0470]EFT47167.1 hypothetical protein HMPREF9501_02033 [Enterococcus faecalis TX0027]EFU16857.1 hypothetical protein HMPREF9519_02171 [Enterococcus faecalis TX1346]EPH72165.1 hypothetical protein D927_03224 [Enterococcus faecalis 02-MB-BW-10]EPH85491.1 hypothetical protein D924_01036 [Enterococcus faecalis 06-MB-S-10]EPH89737.1 hypothetical protein D923_01542 [Enterococcus faecalis 06-MB-S-04]
MLYYTSRKFMTVAISQKKGDCQCFCLFALSLERNSSDCL